jgi:hypothetical protein
VTAALDDDAPIEYEDDVGGHDGREPVGDDQ